LRELIKLLNFVTFFALNKIKRLLLIRWKNNASIKFVLKTKTFPTLQASRFINIAKSAAKS
jgi:uncharacterized protein (DUF1684 family)